MKNRFALISLILLSLITAIFIYVSSKPHTKHSMIAFPEDEHITYLKSHTTLSALKGQQNQSYQLKLNVSSQTNKPVYLRQDISLLYEDGQLMAILNKWKNNTDILTQSKTIDSIDSGHFEAITLHHAEAHYPHDVIKGKEHITYDHLYIMASPLSHITSFKIPVTPVEKEWYYVLEHTNKQQQHYILEEAYSKFHINPDHYYIFPLTYLYVYNQNALPGLTLNKTHRVISQLWEGLYKNYIMGIKTSDGKVISPIGSSMPYILFDKNGSHLYIVTQAANGELILLKQKL